MILGIDQGTTGTRAGLMDPSTGRFVAQAYLPHRQHADAARPGWIEHDPVEILENTRAVVADVLGRAGGARPTAVGLANQGETALLWDRATGAPLGRAIVWQDTRTQAEMDALAADAPTAARLAALTGLRPDPYFSASKLRWLLDRHAGAADPARLAAGTIDTWLLWHLSGRAAFVTDASTAARTLLYDLRGGDWHPWLLDLFGVPRAVLADVRDSAGGAAPLAVLADGGAPVTASLVDQPAALIGEGCLAPGEVKATFGTGVFVYLNTGDDARPSRAGLLTTIAWRRAGRVTYALDGGIFAAGAVVAWMRDALGLFASDAELDALAASVPDAGGVICVPALVGLAAPYWERRARAAWLGMDLATTRAHLVRAALEGIACRVAQVVRAMEADAGLPIRALRVDGGLTGSATLMQLQADLLGVPVLVSAQPEATLAGACLLAAGADDAHIRAQVRTARTFEPRLSADARAARLDAFERAVRTITPGAR